MSTTLGEGWGLTTMEGMACGIPQIVPQSSALAEWAKPAVKIPCSRVLMHPEVNTTGALVDHEPFVAALKSLHQSKALRDRLAADGLAMVHEKQFQWSDVAGKFASLLRPAMLKRPQSRRLVSRRS
jgi:glycosyltransferase involved in cell wall biosynthesis